MSRASQTMRIDILPDSRTGLKHGNNPPPPRPGGAPAKTPTPPPDALAVGTADFQALFQSVYDAAVIADLTGSILDANSRAVDFFQHSRDELITHNLTHIISGTDAKTIATLNAGLDTERFVLIQAHCERKDKSLFPTEIAVHRLTVRGLPYLCCFVRDITARRQAEEALRTIYRAIQNAATGIAIAELSGEVTYINQAGAVLLGETAEAPIAGRNLRDLIPANELITPMIETVRAGQSWSGELMFIRHDKTVIHIQVTTAANWNTDDELVGMVLSFLDISDRIRARDAENKAERQRVMVESLGTACHHLGQPATVLLASLELLNKVRKTDPAMAEELLISSVEAAESLRTMLHRLNDIAEYKTTAYIEGRGADGISESRILDVKPASSFP